MPYAFSNLSDEEGEAVLAAYQAGLPRRYDDFLSALAQADGPAASVEAGEAGLAEVWSWFIETYIAQKNSPITDAGVAFEIPYWLTPVDFYGVGAEGLYVASGLAAWLFHLLEIRFGEVQVDRESDKRDGNYNQPKVHGHPFFDQIVSFSALKAFKGEKDRLEPDFLAKRFEVIAADIERARGETTPRPVVVGAPAAPTLTFDDEALEAGEVEIVTWEGVDWDLHERFIALIAALPEVEEIVSEDRGHVIVRFTTTDRRRVAALVDEVWRRANQSTD